MLTYSNLDQVPQSKPVGEVQPGEVRRLKIVKHGDKCYIGAVTDFGDFALTGQIDSKEGLKKLCEVAEQFVQD